MVNFEVLSINPTNNVPERMGFPTLEQARFHQRRAQTEGRRLVTIIDSPEQFKEWQAKAEALVCQLKEASGA